MRYLWLVILGVLLAEGAGYWWHRYASHMGLFRFVYRDLLRRRHFDHHIHRYPVKRLNSKQYLESCEVSFQVLAAIMIVIGAALVLSGVVTVSKVLVVLGSGAAYGVLVLGPFHSLYHVKDLWLERFGWFRWLRDFHQIHHLINANYTIFLPIFDILGRSYVSPRHLSGLKPVNQFPGFDASRSSTCGESLFKG